MTQAVDALTIVAIAAGEEAALHRLFQLYCYDNSAWCGEDVLADGSYDVGEEEVAAYIHAAGRTAHWIKVEGALAGFYLTEPASADGVAVQEFADFFILKKYRRQGLAQEVVRRVLLGSAQAWLVAMYCEDRGANAFWRQAFARLPFASVQAWQEEELPQFNMFILRPAGERESRNAF